MHGMIDFTKLLKSEGNCKVFYFIRRIIMKYNIYCDESCHLEHDQSTVMVLGSIWCPYTKIQEVNKEIANIKSNHNIPKNLELKWTKISPSKIELYSELLNYFFSNDHLHFRCIVIPDKKILNHEKFNQTHDSWYYKMYFEMLHFIFKREDSYDIYLDIKDTISSQKVRRLQEVCSNSLYDFSGSIINKVQVIRSEEVAIMQLVDLLIGSVCYENRDIEKRSSAKKDLIEFIKKQTGYSLRKTTLLREDKFNIFVWKAQ